MNDSYLPTVLALTGLLVLAAAVMVIGRITLKADLAISAIRALVQLLAVALVIAWIFTHPQWALVYVVVMLAAATTTAVRRIGCGYRLSPSVLLAITAGAATTVAVVAATGALDRNVQALLPFTAQMIGGAMTAALLSGSRLRDDAIVRWDEVEAALALGAPPRRAVIPIAHNAAQQSLAPALDQTKSAGLVLLPGAFVGLLLGGATPLVAAQVQLLVLFGLIVVQAIAALLTTWLLAKTVGTLKPSTWA